MHTYYTWDGFKWEQSQTEIDSIQTGIEYIGSMLFPTVS